MDFSVSVSAISSPNDSLSIVVKETRKRNPQRKKDNWIWSIVVLYLLADA
jgi:hypothetical protein